MQKHIEFHLPHYQIPQPSPHQSLLFCYKYAKSARLISGSGKKSTPVLNCYVKVVQSLMRTNCSRYGPISLDEEERLVVSGSNYLCYNWSLIWQSLSKKNRTRSNIGQWWKIASFSNLQETWWKWLPHEVFIFTKFHEDLKKIMEFLLMVIF